MHNHHHVRLSPERAVRQTLARQPRDCAFLFDFDGTLAPITSNAEHARPVAEAASVLAQLVQLDASVSIVSARPVDFLREHLDVPGVTLCGVYGLEVRRADGATTVDEQAAAWIPAVTDVVRSARAELAPQGIHVEDKHLSVALHFRTAPELAERATGWARATAARTGLAVQPGRMVVELRPPLDRDKGSVIAEQVHGVSCAWYFGDDKADIAAFEALYRHAGTHGAGDGLAGGLAGGLAFLPVAVAIENPEGGAELAGAADFTLDSPHAVVELLQQLTGAWQPDAAARR